MNLIDDLSARGLIKDCTDLDELTEALKEPLTLYCGMDPTADSLHIGHLQQIMLFRRFQSAGHQVIVLCGGGTAMIGDPRLTSERVLLPLETINKNVEKIKKQLSHFIEFDGKKGILENNYNWLSQLGIMDFLRDYGKHFSVNYMLAKETIASRLETGISYSEFSYMILQSIDYLMLYRKYNCIMQIGGSDQWGNITSGIELIRKIEGSEVKVYGFTSPLLLKADGSKFGKSEGQNIWLDPEKTSAYEFYQFFYNTADDDVIRLLMRYSLKSLKTIHELEESLLKEPEKRLAQIALAEELTELVHSKEALERVKVISGILFTEQYEELSLHELELAFKNHDKYLLLEPNSLLNVLVESKITTSKREARELINAGSIKVNAEVVKDQEFLLSKDIAYFEKLIIIKRGKKKHFVIELN